MISLLNKSKQLSYGLIKINKCYYIPHEIQNRKSEGYYQDPHEVADRLTRIFILHPNVQNTTDITLDSTWKQIGVDQLSLVEIMLEAEQEFGFEMPDEEVERFNSIRDAVEYISKSFWSKL